jgi:hypothetical protein
MGHHITAIIGSRQVLRGLIDRFGDPGPTALPFDLVIIPLGYQRHDALAMSVTPAFEGFIYLKPEKADAIGRAVGDGRALYVETEYFGSMGQQAAALFEDGVMVWQGARSTFEPYKPKSIRERLFGQPAETARSPISQGLARLGVVASIGLDEFDSVGLGRFRSLEDLGLDEYEDEDD